MSFSDLGLSEKVQQAVAAAGYTTPTPIQASAIPHVLQRRDVLGIAQTGTGKTAAFTLPMLTLLEHGRARARMPRTLILEPTRELAAQVLESFEKYGVNHKLSVALLIGGVSFSDQDAKISRGVDVLIATPGRLLDHVGQKTVNLSQVEVLVLDEADRMLDMGFLPDIQRIIQLLPKQRQNLMFSATFSGEIRKLAESFLNDPVTIEVARRNATAENVEQRVYRVADADAKRGAVARLIRDNALEQVIVFSNTKIGASRLARQLERDGLNAAAIHGDKSQQERLATLEGFKRGEIKVLVATDVAARGLDIAELPAVINYDLPYSPEDYVHRIGRTGRAGASGMALSLMVESDARLLAAIEGLIKRKLDPIPLDVPRAPREGRPRRDIPEARPRRERPARREGGSHTGQSTDPFFYKPYEPSPKAADSGPDDSSRSGDDGPTKWQRGDTRRPRAPVAALLGGLRRAS